VQDALALWIERERRRDELLAPIDEAEASLARGEGIVLPKESVQDFAYFSSATGESQLWP
jgi:hypothetical protein